MAGVRALPLWLLLLLGTVLPGCGGYMPLSDQPPSPVRHTHPAFLDEDCVDQKGWCSKLGHKVSLSRCYRHHRSCCASCRRLALTIPHCPFGDKDNFCQSLGVDRPISDCYNHNHTCCHTCHLYDSGIPACPFGDHEPWCSGIGHRYSVSSCYEHEAICCDTCSRFRTTIPGCPYGDRLQWCIGIGEFMPNSSCVTNNDACCQTCHDLGARNRATTIGQDVLREFFQLSTTSPQRPSSGSTTTPTHHQSPSSTQASMLSIPHTDTTHNSTEMTTAASSLPITSTNSSQTINSDSAAAVSVPITNVSQTSTKAQIVTATFSVTRQNDSETTSVRGILDEHSPSTQSVTTDKKTLSTSGDLLSKDELPEDNIKSVNDSVKDKLHLWTKSSGDKWNLSPSSPGVKASTSVPITVDYSQSNNKDTNSRYEKPSHVGNFLENQGLSHSGGVGMCRYSSWYLCLLLGLVTQTIVTLLQDSSPEFLYHTPPQR